jgi:hypothetical protein
MNPTAIAYALVLILNTPGALPQAPAAHILATYDSQVECRINATAVKVASKAARLVCVPADSGAGLMMAGR